MIKCHFCKKEFKLLTSTHLKTHGITTKEYKEKYGPVASDEYKKHQSSLTSGENNPQFGKRWNWTEEQKEKIKGRTAYNKGVPMKEETRQKLSEKAKIRVKNGAYDHLKKSFDERYGPERALEIRKKIKEARAKQVFSQESIQKGAEKRRAKYASGELVGSMKGKKHTKEAKLKMAAGMKKVNEQKTQKAYESKIEMLNSIGYELLNFDHESENKIQTLQIKCNKGHIFERTTQMVTNSKFTRELCPICYPPKILFNSKAEGEIADWLSTYTEVQRNNRELLKSKELDIILPAFNVAIEYDGLYWHSDEFKSNSYHLDKTIECEKKGHQLIHIFEDEWKNKPEIVKSRLLSLIGKNKVIYARKCEVSEIKSQESNLFLRENHLQGSGRANVHLGIFFDKKLVGVMTFLKGDISKKVDTWELNRFCYEKYLNIVGGASKLFKYFTNTFCPEEIITFADRRWSNQNSVYEHIGFEFEHSSPPNYWYYMAPDLKRYHRYSLRKKPTEPKDISESVLRKAEGYLRIYDCGSHKYRWKKG